MRRSFYAALLLASAFAPVAAMAQEDNERGGWRAREEGRGMQQPSDGRPQMQRQFPRPQEPAPEVRAQAPVPAPAPFQAQPERRGGVDVAGGGFGRRGEFRGARPDSGGDRSDFAAGQRPASQPFPQVQQQRQIDGGTIRDGRRDDRQDAQRGWRGPGARGDDRRDLGQDERRRSRDPDWRGGERRDFGQDDRRGSRGRDWRDRDRRDFSQGYHGDWNNNDRNRGWNRDWRRDNRYNYNTYRNQKRYIYRLPRYYAPYGWGYGYLRFSTGFTLRSILFDQDYWIDDPGYYRLPPVYGPYRWVRYFNDALLVDIRTGYVVDTVYDIFW